MKTKNKTSLQFTPAIFDTSHKNVYVYTACYELIINLSAQIEEDYQFVIDDLYQALLFCSQDDVISQLKENKEELLNYIKEKQTKFLKGEY